MTISELVSKIAKSEGKKSQTEIGNIREIVGIISDLLYSDYKRTRRTYTPTPSLYYSLITNGSGRFSKKKLTKKRK